jgi:hypothetical protein
MMETKGLLEWMDFSFTTLAQTQTTEKLPVMWKANNADPMLLIGILLGILVVVLSVVVGTLFYQRWKRYNEFIGELKTLDLNPEEEGTLASMVKRYQMDEPVNILFSPRLFDEMASHEILRVLGSSATTKTKQKFIDQVYAIRTRTYHSDWLESTERPAETERDTPLPFDPLP